MMKWRFLILLLLAIAGHSLVEACPLCYGDTGTSGVSGMNQAILFLLGTTGVVFSGITTFFLFMWKRIRNQRMDLRGPGADDSRILQDHDEQGVPEWKNT